MKSVTTRLAVLLLSIKREATSFDCSQSAQGNETLSNKIPCPPGLARWGKRALQCFALGLLLASSSAWFACQSIGCGTNQ
jgi:hypothetical protein